MKVKMISTRTYDSVYGWLNKGDITEVKQIDAERWQKKGLAIIIGEGDNDGRKAEQRDTKGQTLKKESIVQTELQKKKQNKETEEIVDLDEMPEKEIRAFGKELKIKNVGNIADIEILKDKILAIAGE